jgi:hypothetical protein
MFSTISSFMQVYGSIVRKGVYKDQHVLPLVTASVVDLPDTDDTQFAFQIHHSEKSFEVWLIINRISVLVCCCVV